MEVIPITTVKYTPENNSKTIRTLFLLITTFQTKPIYEVSCITTNSKRKPIIKQSETKKLLVLNGSDY